jgi:uncharacterized protein with PQ loop repeat
METIGYIGALLLAVCAFPQMVMSIRYKRTEGLAWGFLWSWYIGEAFMLAFVIHDVGFTGPLFLNYAANFVMLSVIVYYYMFPKRGL